MFTERKNNELAVDYLLGKLQGAERDAFEEDLFTNVDAVNALSASEHDLIDEYLRDEMSESRRASFETGFLKSDTGRTKVAAARVLHERLFDRPLTTSAVSSPSGWSISEWLRLPSLAWAGGFAMLAAAVLIGGWLILGRSGSAPDIANSGTPESSPQLTEDLPPPRPANEALSPPKDERVERNLPNDRVEKSHTPRIFTATLFPTVRSGDRPTLIVPRDTTTVMLRIVHENEIPFKRYRVQVQDGSGRTILRRDITIRNNRITAPLTLGIESSKLKPGTYEISLLGIGASDRGEELKFYDFVVKKN